jgi:N-acetylmuramoyl-L-alanine amidase
MRGKNPIIPFVLPAILLFAPVRVGGPAAVQRVQKGGVLEMRMATLVTYGLDRTKTTLASVFARTSINFRTRVNQDVAVLRRNVPLEASRIVFATSHAITSISSKVGSLDYGDRFNEIFSPSGSSSMSAANFSISSNPGPPAMSSHEPLFLKTLEIPQPTHLGERSLTRALGLKINRIVIDAGHGGPDTGSTGATGLMEKELSLDLVHRLGNLIQKHLPATEVIYTRNDDSFVPLERRTALANEVGGDLFLSIHANSSDNRDARGVETYYLSLSDATAPMEVAARENALFQGSTHELPELLKKINDNEKITESRDLAMDIQESLEKRIGNYDRGVRKAPFIVLIGANMPAVLAEVSFLSNTQDEQWLMKAENRERVAEGLYDGIKNYFYSTNSLAFTEVSSANNQQKVKAPADQQYCQFSGCAGNVGCDKLFSAISIRLLNVCGPLGTRAPKQGRFGLADAGDDARYGDPKLANSAGWPGGIENRK